MARGGGVTNYVLGIVILIIVVAAVAIPVIQDTLATANITGTAGTILSYVPLFLALLIFVLVVKPIRM